MSNPDQIRAIAICVFRNAGRIPVIDFHHPRTGETFYRPAGGRIEFGEPSERALRREIREELGVEIEAPVLLGVLENIFTYDGRPGHEIVFVYDAKPVDRDLYRQSRLQGIEGNGETFTASWLDLSTTGPHTPPVYPEGLIELLAENSGK